MKAGVNMIFIKKYIALLNIGLFCFLMLGCSGNDIYQKTDEFESNNKSNGIDELDGVWIETEYETYEVGTTNVRVKWYNTLHDNMSFGEMFVLEEKMNGSWTTVSKDTDINYAFTAEGIILNSNDTIWHTYHLTPYTDGLTSGKYRISATFLRDTFEGEDYGTGNYPDYQVYGYFEVANKTIRRNMAVLDDTKIEYLNEEYHFAIYLPKEWEGLQIITEQNTGDKKLDKLFYNIDKEYIVMNLRHPLWTKVTPYQDVSFVIFRFEQWNENVNDATGGNYDSLPPGVAGGANKFVFRINPTAYNGTFKGYEEVIKILGDDFDNRYVRSY